MGIPRPHRVVEGSEKASIKQRIRELRSERDQAMHDGNSESARRARKAIHRQKRLLRRMGHLTH
jgi:hypothetical protein